MQPLGGMRDPFLDGLIVFPKDHFQSDPKVVSGKNGSFSGEGGSIIFSGDSTWSINSDVCIFPVFGEEANGLCLIPTVDSSLKLTGSKTIKPGCDGAKARIFNGQNCYGIGIHSIHVQSGTQLLHMRIYLSDPDKYFNVRTDFSAKTMSDVCGSGGGDDMKGKFGQLMEIWKGRVTKGIEEDEVLKYPYEVFFKGEIYLAANLTRKSLYRARIWFNFCTRLSEYFMKFVRPSIINTLPFSRIFSFCT